MKAKTFPLALGADHGGFELKEQLKTYLREKGHTVHDLGTHSKEAVDYPKIAKSVADLVASGTARFGIMVDGAGIGSAMTANKVPGILAAAAYNETLARNSREHNDANVLTLGAGQVDAETAKRIVDVFLETECTADRHRARVKMIRELDKGGRGMNPRDSDLSAEDTARIADRVRQILQQGGVSALPPANVIPPDKLVKLIDHTLLKPEATAEDIEKLCQEAAKYGFYSVCLNPTWVAKAKQLLRGTSVKVCAVVGFPLGAQSPEIKTLEARRALREGAQEIDMVINIGALKSRDDLLVARDIRGVVEACDDAHAVSKVILETALLSDEEKVRGCLLSMKANADFVKTSTGFSKAGATVEDIALMARTVAPRKLGVKASGGVRTYADVIKMVDAGATRVGSSNSVKILEEATQMASGKR
ncbi:MAG: deoxyribose-phosphate aldolase [Thermoanaerobaculia bacterium]|jgi:deoxyribose-phosphate aldolase|nr:deoxyribose-phosphate aldolase [Thermoanaerobaculia bacterium]